jgi:hypothetical protein
MVNLEPEGAETGGCRCAEVVTAPRTLDTLNIC